jgi:hypothetical protein
LSYLTALTYDPQALIAWRAVSALGLAAGTIADRDPEYVRVHLRRLMWLLSDESGGIGWKAPEAMGEMIRSRPHLFCEFIPILIAVLDMEPEDVPSFRAGTLWALDRLAQIVPERISPAAHLILPCLHDPDAQVRGLALLCLSQIKHPVSRQDLEMLLRENKPVLFYQDGQMMELNIAQLCAQVTQNLAQ